MASSAGGGATTSAADKAEAAKVRTGAGSSEDAHQALSKLPARVKIDEDEVQKYVLVQVKLDPPIYFVRGDAQAT